MSDGIIITGDVVNYQRFLTSGITLKILEREIRKSTIKNALFLVRKVKESIRQKKFTKNSPLTIALKRGNTPLIDQRNLLKAISKEIKSSFEAEVGIVKNIKTTGGKGSGSPPFDMKKVVLLLHEGYTITVTQEMRAAIAAALREKGGRQAASARKAANVNTGSGRDTFRVPPRKFLTRTFKNKAVQEVIKRNWRLAVEEAFRKTKIGAPDFKDR